MKEDMIRLIQEMVAQECARLAGSPSADTPEGPTGIRFTDLPRDDSTEPLAREWNLYCQEVGRLLADGHEGRYVLIKGDEIVGVFEEWATARMAGLQRYQREPFFVHEIRTIEPHLFIRGINRPWPD